MADKAIFLDRDDTLIADPGYISSPDQVKLLNGVPQALNEFKKMGYKLVIVSNQSGIARGIFTEETLHEIHDRLEQLLKRQDVLIDKIYYCPYLADGAVEKYRKDSNDRKPNPGMLLKASKEMDIDLESSWMIGDSERDVLAGKNAGCKTILIRPSSQTIGFGKNITVADHVAVNIREAVNIVKQFRNVSKSTPAEPKPVEPSKPEPDESFEPQIDEPVQTSIETKPMESQPQLFDDHEDNPEVEQFEQTTTAQNIPTEEKEQQEEDTAVDSPPKKIDETQNRNFENHLEIHPPVEPEPKTSEPEMKMQQIKKTHSTESLPENDTAGILKEILSEIKAMRRDDLFGDFSILRLIAGAVQVIVLLCLLVSIWILMNPANQQNSNPALITLAFAGVLQIMALTFYIMQGPR